jgi:beta-glucosidase-like glycosyl hydrolase
MKLFLDRLQRRAQYSRSLKPGGLLFRSLLGMLLVCILVAGSLPATLSVGAQTTNLALNRPVTCSSVEFPCAEAVDGNTGTRWASAQGVDPQWIYVDLGATYNITRVVLTWEAAYATGYQIQVAAAAAGPWTNIFSTTTGNGATDDLTGLSGSGRYVRMNGTARATGYGYSLWEFQVYGTGGTVNTNTPTRTNTPAAGCGTTNVALNKPATSSSNENAGSTPNLAVDGNATGTRWSSLASDPQWIQIDLGATQSICRVVLTWEAAYGTAYQVQVSNSATGPWTNIFATTTGNGATDDLAGLSGSGRYIRMNGTARATGFGYSLWEFAVYTGSGGPINTPTRTNTPVGPTFTPTRTNTPGGSAVSVQVVVPIVEYVQIGLSPADLTGRTTVITQNTSQTATLSYTNGTAVTFAINSMTSGTGQTATFSAVDSGGVTRTGAPLTITVFPGLVVNLVLVSPTPTAIPNNLALNKPATASSSQAGLTPAMAVDGNTGTRWGSDASDPQWLQIDLGSTQTIARVVLNWEAAYGKSYQIQTSAAATGPWTNIYATTTGDGGTDDLIGLTGSGRYIRINGTARGSVYGYSLWEFAVYASGPAPTATLAPSPTPTATAPAAFSLLAPANNAMITNTRRPALSWNALSGTVRYEVWMNISRTDYDFTASGNLLDRYTKLADVTGTSYTPAIDLSDRWTYKWYVNAVDGANVVRKSNTLTFGVYLPLIETLADGVNIVNGARDMNKNGAIEPYEDWHLPVETRVNDLLSRMTALEKAYQMFYNAQVYPLAGWAMGPMSPQDLYNKQLAAAGTRLGIPMVSPGDTIHGYMTTYPVQSALAAGRDYLTIYQLGDMQRREEYAVGARGVLGPLAEVDTKVLYPRFQEGNGENADIAAAVTRAIVAGLQGGPELNPGSVLVTTKHWPGEGAGGEAGITYDAVTIKYHMIPWRAAFEAGSGGVMPGYAGSSFLDPGGPGAGDSPLIINYLRANMGYDGLVTTDWLPSGSWINAAKAGSDVMGGADPGAAGFDMNTFVAQVPASRIDEAVRRILRVKFRLGVFETPYGDPANGPNVFHTPANMALVTKAAKGAMTLLKNTGILPLRLNAGDYLLVTGARATDGPSCCIWTSYFHADLGSQTMWQAIQQRAQQAGLNACLDTCPVTPKAAIVITGEPSYTHGTSWPKEQPYLTADQLALIQNLKNQGLPVVVVYTMPRPYVIATEAQIANAIVIAYRSGEGGGPALAQLLFGDYAPTGKLPFQLPRDMNQIGTDVQSNQLEMWDLPYDLGATAAERTDIRNKINAGIAPPTTYGNPLYSFGAGLQGFGLTDSTAPTAFNLSAPANGATVSNNLPTLSWQASADPETGIQHYQVFVDNVKVAQVTTISYTLTQQLAGGAHNWYVVATNWAGGTRTSSTFSFNFQDTQVPNAFELVSPANAASVTGSTQTLVWENSLDTGSGLHHYEVWLDGANVASVNSNGALPTSANLALNKPAIASSTQGGANPPAAVTDGNPTATRWESQYSDPQWIYVDLGQAMEVTRVKLTWEAAYGRSYQIQVSNDATNWTNIYATTTGDGGVDDLSGLRGYGRYVRMYGTARALAYGYSLYEFEVYGGPVQTYTRSGLSLAAHSWFVVAVDAFGNRRQSTSTYTFTAH